jgi:hypothetical protein
MHSQDDASHREALSTALGLVLADRQDPDSNRSVLAEPFIAGAPTPADAGARIGLVCQYLTKIASQLAGVVESASPEAFDQWAQGMRDLTK